ncbi:MAG TPA: hypothetical protein VFC78_11820 [Tepidisphaeraceae bacterium]|nr:hypothetical protein [Tepidisphaeraceae bacterium]
MDWNIVAIFSRWLHVITACVAIGSVFFLYVLLPIGLRGLDPVARDGAYLRCRRGLKMVFHSAVLLFLATGTYNAINAWKYYTRYPAVLHGLFGVHLLLALTAIALLLAAFAGREPRRSNASLLRWSLVAMFLAVAAASTLKAGREWVMVHPNWSPPSGK